MTELEAGAMLHLNPPFTVEQVEDAYNRAMQALHNAYRSTPIGTQMDEIDDKKRKAGEARKVLLGSTRRPPPPYSSPPFYQRPPIPPPMPLRRVIASMGPAAAFIYQMAERLLLGLFDVTQALFKGIANLSPEGKKVLAAIAIALAIPTMGRFIHNPSAGVSQIKILSHPKADVYIDGTFLASAPFVHPARVSVKEILNFRFQNPGYPAIERTLSLKCDQRYVIKVDFEDNSVQVEEVLRWGRQ